MAQRSYDECDRTATRGVQAQDQDAGRAAVGRYSGHVVMGAACFRLQINMRNVDGLQSLATQPTSIS
jgi:hypothetical protein